MPRFYATLAAVLATLVVLALAGWGGYRYRDAVCRADGAETERAVSDALALLAQRYAIADAEATTQRQAREALAAQRVRRNVDAATALPDRGCGLTPDERSLLDDTYCAAFPDAAGCLPAAVPAAGTPAKAQ